MKTLYLMRHGQKEENSNKNDYDIQLTSKGIKNIKKISSILKNKNIKLDQIITSPAIRAEETAQIVAKTLAYKKQITKNEIIYRAFLNELEETITYTYDDINSMLLVGHNPSLSAFAFTYCDFRKSFEMGCLIRIDFHCNSWINISKNNAQFIYFENPNN